MANVNIDLVANVQKAVKGFQGFSRQASAAVAGVSDSFLNLRTLATGALAGVGFAKIVQAAAEQEQAVQKLNTALALSGELSEETTQSFLDFTSALQANSTVGDEVSLGLVGLTKSFGATNEQAKTILQTAADLSAVTGESLESSVRNLAKTLGGLKGELGETQPELKALTEEQLKNGDAITILSQKYSGAAKALTKTFSGALTQTSNSFGDLLEEVGEFVTANPAVIAAINLAGEVFSELGAFIEENRDAISEFVQAGIERLVKLIPTAIRVVGKFVAGVQSIKLAFEGALFVVSSFAGGVLRLFDNILEGLQDFILLGLEPVIDTVESLIEGLETIGVVSSGTAESFRLTANKAVINISKIGSALDGAVEATDEFAEGVATSAAGTIESISETAESFESIAEETEKYAGRLDTLREEAENSQAALQKLSDTNNALAESTGKAQSGLDDQIVGYGVLTEEYQKATEAANNFFDGSLRSGFGGIPEAPTPVAPDDPIQIPVAPSIVEPNFIEDLLQIPVPLPVQPELIKKEPVELEADVALRNIQQIGEGFSGILRNAVQDSGLGGLVSDAFSGIAGFIPDSIKGAVDIILPGSEFTNNLLGAANQLLGGAEGAKNLIVQGSAAAANAFFPGLGTAVGPLVDALAAGPDAVREQIDAFIEAFPVILDNIARAIPVLVEGLAEAAPDIIVALVKAAPAISRAIIVGLARLPLILAKEAAGAIAAELDAAFGTTISTDFATATDNFAATTEELQGKYVSSIEDGTERILGNLQSGLNTFTSTFERFGNAIVSGIKTTVANLASDFSSTIGAALENFILGFRDGVTNIFSKLGTPGFIKQLGNFLDELLAFEFPTGTELAENLKAAGRAIDEGLGSFLTGFRDSIKRLFSFPGFQVDIPEIKLPEFPELKIPDLKGVLNAPFNAVIDLLNSLKVPRLGASGKILGRGFNVEILPETDLIPGTIPRLATGGTVPEGFPNDSFPAALTSGEEVFDTSTSQQLRNFLSEQQTGEGGTGQPMIIQLNIGEKQLADVLVNINRQGFRVNA